MVLAARGRAVAHLGAKITPKGPAMRQIAFAAVLMLSACGVDTVTLPPLDAGPAAPAVPGGPADACGASGLQVLVGQDVALFEAQNRPGPVRILRPNQPVTMDFSEARLNVAIDERNRITRIYCG
jgi:hypothetical protein